MGWAPTLGLPVVPEVYVKMHGKFSSVTWQANGRWHSWACIIAKCITGSTQRPHVHFFKTESGSCRRRLNVRAVSLHTLGTLCCLLRPEHIHHEVRTGDCAQYVCCGFWASMQCLLKPCSKLVCANPALPAVQLHHTLHHSATQVLGMHVLSTECKVRELLHAPHFAEYSCV